LQTGWLSTTKQKKCFTSIRSKALLTSSTLTSPQELSVSVFRDRSYRQCHITKANRKVWFTLQKLSIPGIPDGMTIDSDGNLWVAVFGGGRVLKVDGSKSETLLDTIEIPAEQVIALDCSVKKLLSVFQVTSVAFGGKNLDELYVTTAAVEIQNKKPVRPVDGAVYKVTGTGSKGLPGASFKL
jgi:gluconolactonase